MLVLSAETFAIALQGVKFIAIIALLVVLLRAGRKYPELATTSWQWIIVGFVMMVVAFAVDLTGEFINYGASYMPHLFSIFIEEGALICGLFLIATGFSTWFEFVGRFLGLTPRE